MPAAAPSPADPAAEPVLDRSALDALAVMQTPGEPDLIEELGGIFFGESAPRMERLRAALAAKDHLELHREAHGLKGSAASLGAKRLAAVARRLEARAADSIPADAADLIRRIEQENEHLRAEFRVYQESRRSASSS